MELCPALGISIPVGKDSLSMRTHWQDATGAAKEVVSPVSLIVTAFAPVADVRATLTPQLRTRHGDTVLIAIDLGRGTQSHGRQHPRAGDAAGRRRRCPTSTTPKT